MSRGLRLSFRVLLICLFTHLAPKVLPAQNQSAPTPILSTTQSRRQVLVDLTSERDRLRATGDTVSLVRTINQIGDLHLKLGDPDSALADAKESLVLARQLTEDKALLVDTLTLSARVHLYHQDNATAVRLLNEAHLLSVRVKYRYGEAQSLAQFGVAYFQLSELPNAEKSNEAALQIWRELNDQRGEARTLTNQGETYMRLEKGELAAAALEEAATIWRTVGDSAELATTLVDLNFLAIRQGQWQKALSALNEAQLLVTDKDAEPYLAGQIATSFGEIYEAYGQLDTALDYFREALVLYRDRAHDKSGTIDVGSKAARVQARLGEYAQAAQQIEEGLKLAQEIRDEFMAGLCHEDLGRVWLEAGSYDQARQEFLKAIDRYQRTGNTRPWARAQTFLGQTEYLRGHLASAAISYGKALRAFKTVKDYTNEAALCFGLGKLELERQQMKAAGEYLQRSITLTEQLRANAASRDLRSSFLASVHDRYETYVEWLMQKHAREPDKGFDVAAFEASEQGRARSLLDSLKDAHRELRQVSDPALLLEEEKIQKAEQELLDKQAKLQSEGGSRDAREKVQVDLNQARAQYEALKARISTAARFQDLLNPAPLKFAEIKAKITNADNSLLEFSLGRQKSHLWVVSEAGMTYYELPDKNTIEEATNRLAVLLAKQPTGSDEAELNGAIAEVSRLVLGPVAGKLPPTRLIIVADGILQYVPFQILISPDRPNQPLIADHEIVYAPSASTLAIVQQEAISRSASPKILAALGAPVLPSNYNLQASTAGAPGASELRGESVQPPGSLEDRDDETVDPNKLQPLFYASRELNELRKLAPAEQTVIYSDFAATRENLRNLDLSQYRILHFATHGLLNAKHPELSALVLSLVDRNGQRVNGVVGLSDVYRLRAPLDLVVLSACRTGLGKDVRGEGLIGLTRGFMYAGASSVVASLWKVDDEATAELMKLFYINMLQRRMTPAAALRAAQNSIRQQPQWRSPYYWAAFTLQGDYREVIRSTPVNPSTTFRNVTLAGSALLLVGLVWWYRRYRAMRIAQKTAATQR